MARIHSNSVYATGRATRRSFLPAGIHSSTKLRGLLAVALLLSCLPPVRALEPTTPLANYGRQLWGMENGLPQNTVQALAQTKDGFVWLGTEVGLVRFDGNSFAFFDKNSTPALPGNDVRCLLETRDGALWIGTSEGLARWKSGEVTAFTTKDGLPGNVVRALNLDYGGGLWVWMDGGLAKLKGERFVFGGDWLPSDAITAVTAHGESGFWIETVNDEAVRGNEGKTRVAAQVMLHKEEFEFLARLPGPVSAVSSKNMLVVGRGDIVLGPWEGVLTSLAVGHDLPGTRIQTLFADREGSLWIGTNGGLSRWTLGKLERLPVTDPLSSASVLAIMEDREGNLWVGTETGGLHILRDQRFRTLGAREGLSSDNTTAVVEDGAGTLWVGTNGSGLNALHRSSSGKNQVKTYSVLNGLMSDVILSLAAAPNGDVWVGTPDGLNRIRGSKVEAFTSADGLPDDFIRSLLADADGSLWIGTRRGLTHWTGLKAGAISGGRMETYTQSNGLGNDLVGAMARDAHGDLWVATLAGLSRLHEGKIEIFSTRDGLLSNVITALATRKGAAPAFGDETLLIGTQDSGWNLWNGEQFFIGVGDTLNLRSGQSFSSGMDHASIRAILDDEQGHLWFATGTGIARCDDEPGINRSPCMEFGSADGLRSRETATNSHPSAWRSRDGHLWFATPKGLVEIDPAHFPVNTVPPPVALERFAVDDIPLPLHAAGSSLRVAAGHVHFQFDYAGLSFTAPQKVRYRFILDGFDHGWTEAGALRSAYYTNIPPGRYTFRVQAANNDGLWNTEGTALAFELLPHFYQTIWFYALLLAGAAGVIVLLLRLRLRHAESEFRAVLGERNRIAREIHDTLAQGYVGISVQLEVLAELLHRNEAEAAARHLDSTRGFVREGLAEARQSIWALRSQDAGETTLPVRLRRMVDAENSHGLTASFNIFGAYRSVPPGTESEFLRVAQEAIRNVKKHAEARHLFVQLDYSPDAISLEVRDDGRGFVVDSKPEFASGQYGLTGMKERAAAIGGTLEIHSEPGVGTTVRLHVFVLKEVRNS